MASSTTDKGSSVITRVETDDDTLTAELSDGRTIKVPLDWYPRLSQGSLEERKKYRLIGGGSGIHWPLLDEDVSLDNLLEGRKSAESQASFERWLKSRPPQQESEAPLTSPRVGE